MTGKRAKRTKRIIAIFGGSSDPDVLALAEELGHSVATENQILLTGGTGPARDAVKNIAILGAMPSPWIGVDRKKSGGAEGSPQPNGGYLIRSDLDHKRNYLEACMCDAAICLEGGSGTSSELTCALSLQRPVAIVGDGWKDVCNGLNADTSRTLDTLVKDTLAKFADSHGDNHELDSHLTREGIRKGLDRGLRHKCFGSGSTARSVVAWIIAALPAGEAFPGFVPSGVHASVAARYDKWLVEREDD
jgi:predicted Rossmann-fold nucleotide-binding protein